MKPDILELQPHDLQFNFELKKQSSCAVQMINKTNQHVAFKIKTTNPKKYCVRPNTGVIDPNSSCDFTVTMQAQKVAPPDMICRDKFLVQSTFVSEGTKEEDVTSETFAKEDGKLVDEKRLKVILIPTPDSPESSPTNGTMKIVHSNESRELKDDTIQKDSSQPKVDGGMEVFKVEGESVEATRREDSVIEKEAVKRNKETVKRNEELVERNEEPVERNEEPVKRNEEPVKQSQEFMKRNEEFVQINDTEELVLAKNVEEMKLKVKELEVKLNEAKATILHLSEEKRLATQEKHFLQGELDLLRSKRHRAQVGFPLLYVFMVALVSLYLGYLLHH
uniref:vesicle-associated protein 1-2-like n=1 Tax=Erigeron canadensis TaxID=72917 RepID=UPI001CB963C0|nr:vesicle-associated protein 1-2-like [Erigeron canadensis]XP_043605983.1 vesicle-associated protein 1-2-like [Erigeron canadensis]